MWQVLLTFLHHAADVPVLHSSRTSAVVIFDEAHNLASICQSIPGMLRVLILVTFAHQENVCAEASSFDLPAAHLAMCIQEVRTAAPIVTMSQLPDAFQANECWELAVGAEEGGPTQVGRPAEDFRLLKSLLRMLEQRIAQEVSTVRNHVGAATLQIFLSETIFERSRGMPWSFPKTQRSCSTCSHS